MAGLRYLTFTVILFTAVCPNKSMGLPDEKIYSYGWSRDGKTFAFTLGNEIRDIILLSSSR